MSRIKRKKSKGFSLDDGKSSYRKFNRKQIFREIINWIIFIFVAAVLGYGFVAFGVQSVRVNGSSMENTLNDGDVVLLNKFSYKLADIKRNDVVAIKRINDNSYYDIKRVVGLPGETIQIIKGQLFVNGEPVKNDVLDNQTIITSGIAEEPILLGKDEYFVMGDNVNNSEDSRYSNYGNILGSEIKGKVFYKIKPSEKKGKIK